MDISSKELCNQLLNSRHQHPSWQLLAARRAPLIIGCLKPLFESQNHGVALEDAERHLAEMLAEHANNEELLIEGDDYGAIARRELRDWIKRNLVVEREGKLIATDALQQALQFVEKLNNRLMTSTASRLATVQREIENLEMLLNPDPKSRAIYLKGKIKALQQELSEAEAGNVSTLEESKAIEGIREVYNLATSLRADFRRVEDSYREADRLLRQSIISERQHRGDVVDKLLDSHAELLNTTEGQVFYGFHEQLNRSIELDHMKHRLRNILRNPKTEKALHYRQQSDLRWLIAHLVRESANVIRARARSERDVKGFLKTGLAAEHHRVGQLLNRIFEAALDIDWGRSSVRRLPSTLPPIGITLGNLPLIERIRFKNIEDDSVDTLELREIGGDINEIENDFWEAFDTLDRQALIHNTLDLLTTTGQTMTIRELSQHLPPSHDLETIALWLSMAREAELSVSTERESLDVVDRTGNKLRFHVPKIEFSAQNLQNINWEL